MKSYYDYLDELTSNEVFERLLKYGLFNNRIPPIFQMEEFYNYVSNVSLKAANDPADYMAYKTNRNNNLPRILSIPTPFTYYHLVKVVSSNWGNLKTHFASCTISDKFKRSQVHPRNLKTTKGIIDLNYSNYIDDKCGIDNLLANSKYVVKADIANCYPSIYSHSIGWALVGKSTAKDNKKNWRLWYNKLDKAVRHTKDGETQGLIIGPHTSSIISEVILCKVDSNLNHYNYIRHIDDYTCFIKEINEVELFLNDLQKELAKYGLILNEKKTKVTKMPDILSGLWVEELKQFVFEKHDNKIKYNSLKHFLNKATRLSIDEGNAAIIYYAQKIILNGKLTVNALEYYKIFQFMQLRNQPYFFPFFEENCIIKCKLSKDDISKVIKDNLPEAFAKSNYEAIAYCLYYAIKYKVNFTDVIDFDLILASIATEDPITLLLAYLYTNGNLAFKSLALEIRNRGDFDKYWCFCYEVLDEIELNEPKLVKTYWLEMKRNGVSFLSI